MYHLRFMTLMLKRIVQDLEQMTVLGNSGLTLIGASSGFIGEEVF